MDPSRSHTGSDRIRTIGSTISETTEVLGFAESRLARTAGEVAGEATRAIGSAAARTATELRPESDAGQLLDAAGSASARAIEAGGRLAGEMLEAGAIYARDLADAATDAAVTAARLRRERQAEDGMDEQPAVLNVVQPPTSFYETP